VISLAAVHRPFSAMTLPRSTGTGQRFCGGSQSRTSVGHCNHIPWIGSSSKTSVTMPSMATPRDTLSMNTHTAGLRANHSPVQRERPRTPDFTIPTTANSACGSMTQKRHNVGTRLVWTTALDAFQADDEGSIPFTRSNVLKHLRHGPDFIPTRLLLLYAVCSRNNARLFSWLVLVPAVGFLPVLTREQPERSPLDKLCCSGRGRGCDRRKMI
jgi:hypothetical protein